MSWIDIQGMYFFGGENMNDLKYMKQAITIAKQGYGFVNPNPVVGAVIVKNHEIIAQGYHEKYGGLHAEKQALLQCQDTRQATMYITLEPCNHHGKTPPCVDAIIQSGITRVVIGTLDPNPMMSGKSVALLKKANIQVDVGILEEECKQLIVHFHKYITTRTPYVLMKYAMTIDGKIATCTKESKWISNTSSRQHVQQTRKEYQAIMVGVQTIIDDDPSLTCRIPNCKQMIRIICDTNLRTPLTSKVVQTAHEIPTWIATCSSQHNKIIQFQSKGCKILQIQKLNNQIDLQHLMQVLGDLGVSSIILEGGGNLHWSALHQKIVDKLHVYIAPKLIGGKHAPSPIQGVGISRIKDAIQLRNTTFQQFEKDIFIESDVIYPCLQES